MKKEKSQIDLVLPPLNGFKKWQLNCGEWYLGNIWQKLNDIVKDVNKLTVKSGQPFIYYTISSVFQFYCHILDIESMLNDKCISSFEYENYDLYYEATQYIEHLRSLIDFESNFDYMNLASAPVVVNVYEHDHEHYDEIIFDDSNKCDLAVFNIISSSRGHNVTAFSIADVKAVTFEFIKYLNALSKHCSKVNR